MYVSIKQYKLVPANGSDALKFEGEKVTTVWQKVILALPWQPTAGFMTD